MAGVTIMYYMHLPGISVDGAGMRNDPAKS